MFTRLFNRHRRLGAEPLKEPCLTFDPEPPPVPPDAEPLPDGEENSELAEMRRIMAFVPPQGWAHTETGLFKVVNGLQTLP